MISPLFGWDVLEVAAHFAFTFAALTAQVPSSLIVFLFRRKPDCDNL